MVALSHNEHIVEWTSHWTSSRSNRQGPLTSSVEQSSCPTEQVERSANFSFGEGWLRDLFGRQDSLLEKRPLTTLEREAASTALLSSDKRSLE